jgi:hypothetical protein
MTPPTPASLSPDQRLALLEELERREAGSMRRAIRGAWVALLAVGLLVGSLVFVSWLQLRDMRGEVAMLTAQEKALADATREQTARLEELNGEIAQKQAALSALIGAVRTDPRALSGIGSALDKNPRAVTLVPRVYIQILDTGDRQWARNLSDRLQNAGVIPVGIEYVPNARPQSTFDVRYYKQAEEDGARRIVGIMKEAGVDAELKYLNLEANTRVRANHFEIWCPPNARATKLRPLTSTGY